MREQPRYLREVSRLSLEFFLLELSLLRTKAREPRKEKKMVAAADPERVSKLA